MNPDIAPKTPNKEAAAAMADAPIPVTAPASVGVGAAQPAGESDRNFLAAFLLTTMFGMMGLHQLYLGRTTQAWIRFIMYITLVLSIVSIIWGIIDFFKVYFNKTDADGKVMSGAARDFKTAKIIFWVYIGFWILYALGIVFFLSLAANGYNTMDAGSSY